MNSSKTIILVEVGHEVAPVVAAGTSTGSVFAAPSDSFITRKNGGSRAH